MATPFSPYDPAQTGMRNGRPVRIDSPSPDGSIAHYGPGNRFLYRTPGPKSAEEQGRMYEQAQADFARGRASVRPGASSTFATVEDDYLSPSDPNNPDSPLVRRRRAANPFVAAEPAAPDMSMAPRMSTAPSAWSMGRETKAQEGRAAGNDRLATARDAAAAGTLQISRTPQPSARLTPEEQARGASVEFQGKGPAGTATVQTRDGRMVTLSGDEMASRDSARAAMARPAPAPSPFNAATAAPLEAQLGDGPETQAAIGRYNAALASQRKGEAESAALRQSMDASMVKANASVAGANELVSDLSRIRDKVSAIPDPLGVARSPAPVAKTPAGKPIPATMEPVAAAAPVASASPAPRAGDGMAYPFNAIANSAQAIREAGPKRVAASRAASEAHVADVRARAVERRNSTPFSYRDPLGRPVNYRLPNSVLSPDFDAGALRTTSPTMQFKMGLKKQNNPSVFTPFSEDPSRTNVRMFA